VFLSSLIYLNIDLVICIYSEFSFCRYEMMMFLKCSRTTCDGLTWYQNNSLASSKEVKCVEFKHLVGTVAPMVSVERVGKHVALYYKWDHPPTQHVVLEHFKNIILEFLRVCCSTERFPYNHTDH
jgi:hypothetical protein